ncbi:MAG: hypothetical protein K6T88_04455 [Bacillus sp. (in: Bacteria)]|nr:hypothetical protein [Bacillus sp. (in: firmicutes)]
MSKFYNADATSFKKSDVRFLYDLNGNLIKKWIYDESSNTTQSGVTYPFVRSESTYEYDANNRFTREQNSQNGMVTVKEYKDDENTEIVRSALGTTTIEFNENDLATKVITPRNEQYNMTYTASEQKDLIKGPRLTVDMDYGPNEKMTSIQTRKKDTTTVLFSETYSYNNQEQILRATNPWVGQKSYTYSPEGFLKTVTKGTETLTYSNDVNGNLLKSVNQSGKILLENQYGQGNRITSSIQYDSTALKYKKVTYFFRPDGSLQKEIISKVADTYEAAKIAVEDYVKEYEPLWNNSRNKINRVVTGTEIRKTAPFDIRTRAAIVQDYCRKNTR